jgi:hypothetical protein
MEEVPVLLTVVPSIPESSQRKRQNDDSMGGFIGAPNTAGNCSVGTPFNLTGGQLSSHEQVIGTNPGLAYIGLMTSSTGSISTTFSIIDSMLHWRNESFLQQEAGFCQTTGGRVYATFTSSESWPPDCSSVSIIVYKGKDHTFHIRSSSSDKFWSSPMPKRHHRPR